MAQIIVKIFKSIQDGPGFIALLLVVAALCALSYAILYALVG